MKFKNFVISYLQKCITWYFHDVKHSYIFLFSPYKILLKLWLFHIRKKFKKIIKINTIWTFNQDIISVLVNDCLLTNTFYKTGLVNDFKITSNSFFFFLCKYLHNNIIHEICNIYTHVVCNKYIYKSRKKRLSYLAILDTVQCFNKAC